MNLQDNTLRLQVYLARAGIASRRACEEIIRSARVTVNGIIVTEMGTKITPGQDVVLVDGQRIQPEETLRYVVLHKPSGYVCSLSDEKNRPVAADLVRNRYPERLYNIGRLDMYSSGILLFTNDGEFAAVVGHPRSGIEKEYIVEASLPFRDSVIDAFSRGIRIDGVFYKCKSISRLSSRKMAIVLVEGKNREIRRVLEHFDIRVKSLQRIRFGPVSLNDLPCAEMRDLTETEILALKGSAHDNSN